jgi:hypothetical protein
MYVHDTIPEGSNTPVSQLPTPDSPIAPFNRMIYRSQKPVFSGRDFAYFRAPFILINTQQEIRTVRVRIHEFKLKK